MEVVSKEFNWKGRGWKYSFTCNKDEVDFKFELSCYSEVKWDEAKIEMMAKRFDDLSDQLLGKKHE